MHVGPTVHGMHGSKTCIYRRLGGIINAVDPQTGKLVLLLFRVRVMRASGRSCVGVRVAMCFPMLVARLATFPPPARLGRGFAAGLFVAICKGFKDFAEILLLCARVLRIRNTD